MDVLYPNRWKFVKDCRKFRRIADGIQVGVRIHIAEEFFRSVALIPFRHPRMQTPAKEQGGVRGRIPRVFDEAEDTVRAAVKLDESFFGISRHRQTARQIEVRQRKNAAVPAVITVFAEDFEQGDPLPPYVRFPHTSDKAPVPRSDGSRRRSALPRSRRTSARS